MLSARTTAAQLFVIVYNRGSHSGICVRLRLTTEFALQTRSI